MTIQLTRKIILDRTGLRIDLGYDFSRYYQWLIHKHFYDCKKTQLSKHGSHVSIITKKLHGPKFNREKLAKYHKMEVELSYDINMVIGGNGFDNFWFRVDFPLGDEIKREAGIVEKNFLGFHVTVCNTKAFSEKYTNRKTYIDKHGNHQYKFTS